MARKATIQHPEWALKYKTKGTELRLQRGRYYLYQVHSEYDKKIKRSRKITDKFLGTITEADGLIKPKAERVREQQEVRQLWVREGGMAEYFTQKMERYATLLREYFPEHWQTIIAMAYCRLVWQSPLKNMDYHWKQSYLSELYPEAKMSKNSLSKVVRSLGQMRQQVIGFCRRFSASGGSIVFDGTDLSSASIGTGLTHHSKSKRGDFQDLANLMCVFSVKEMLPLYYRLLPGNIRDVKSFQLSLLEAGISNAVIILDKGFFSKANLNRLDKVGLKYIIPLKRSAKENDYSRIGYGSEAEYDGFFTYHGRCIWYCRSTDNPHVIMFLDEDMRQQERSDFIRRMTEADRDGKKNNYTPEILAERSHRFGVIGLYTNTEENERGEYSPSDIYLKYKTRPEVEQMIDTFKNVLDCDKAYMCDRMAYEGWMFVNFIALHWYYNIYHDLLLTDTLTSQSVQDTIHFLTGIKRVRINNEWHWAEMTKKSEKSLKILGLPIT